MNALKQLNYKSHSFKTIFLLKRSYNKLVCDFFICLNILVNTFIVLNISAGLYFLLACMLDDTVDDACYIADTI